MLSAQRVCYVICFQLATPSCRKLEILGTEAARCQSLPRTPTICHVCSGHVPPRGGGGRGRCSCRKGACELLAR